MKAITLRWGSALAIGLIFPGACKKEIEPTKPVIIGHRGLPTLYTENTAESFDGLLKAKISQVETDVLMAKGDTVMIFHDPEVSRLTNFSGQLTDFTPAQIKDGIKATSRATGLTLHEFLDCYVNRFKLIYLDLKDGQGDRIYAVVDDIIQQVQKRGIHHKIVITSTSETVLEYIQNNDHKIKLAPDFGQEGLSSAIRHRFRYCLVPLSDLSVSLYAVAHSAHIKLITYTTTNIVEGEQAMLLGCDGIMTDVGLEMAKLYGIAEVPPRQ